jgi:peptide deformylase
MNVIKLGNEQLRKKSEPVKNINADYESLALDMIETLHSHGGIGLAAPQVGILERMFVIHVENDSPRVFINPSIIETSEETVAFEEGCLSIPGVYCDVKRPKFISVQAWNEKGKPFTINDASGILARVILHESDHLDGVLFIDHLSEAKRDRILEKYEKLKNAKAKQK